VLAYTESGRDEFFVSPMIQDAVVRNLEIVGEAAKRVSPSLRERAPGMQSAKTRKRKKKTPLLVASSRPTTG
jgi:uncharacterized protein with HEPN domain